MNQNPKIPQPFQPVRRHPQSEQRILTPWEYRLQAEAGDADRMRPGLPRRPLLDQGRGTVMVCSLPSLAVRTFIMRTVSGAALAMIHAQLPG